MEVRSILVFNAMASRLILSPNVTRLRNASTSYCKALGDDPWTVRRLDGFRNVTRLKLIGGVGKPRLSVVSRS
jgi:hypothetical protein